MTMPVSPVRFSQVGAPVAQPVSQGAHLGLNFLERRFFGFCDGFLRMSSMAENGIKKRLLEPNKLAGMSDLGRRIRTWFGNFLAGSARNVLDHDYKETVPLWRFGRIVVEPPMGALVALLFGATLGGRLNHAIHRAVGGDRRELRDILCRDLPTFVLILFALNPMVRFMSSKLQQWKGIQLVQDGAVFGYSQLENIYRVTSAHRLKSLLAKSENHKGMLRAIENTMANNSLSDQMKNLLAHFKSSIEHCIKLAPNGAKSEQALAALEAPANRAYGILQQLNQAQANYLRNMEAGVAVGEGNFVRKLVQKFTSKVPVFTDMFAAYAKSSRVWANAVAYASVIGLLGFGVTAFNQWFTEREYKRLQSMTPPVATRSGVGGLNPFTPASYR